MRATTSGTSTRKPSLIFDADLHGLPQHGNVDVPVVGWAAGATGPSVDAVSWRLRRDGGQRDGERKKRRRREKSWGGGAFYTPTHVPSSSATGPSLLPCQCQCQCHMAPSQSVMFTLFTLNTCKEGALTRHYNWKLFIMRLLSQSKSCSVQWNDTCLISNTKGVIYAAENKPNTQSASLISLSILEIQSPFWAVALGQFSSVLVVTSNSFLQLTQDA